MKKFLFLYRHQAPDASTPPPSPEQMQQIMAAWMTWIDKFRKAGQMTDPGDGLQHQGRVVRASGVTDGPFVEAKEVLGGYSIIAAESFDAAVAIAKECPAVFTGGSVEVREFAGWI